MCGLSRQSRAGDVPVERAQRSDDDRFEGVPISKWRWTASALQGDERSGSNAVISMELIASPPGSDRIWRAATVEVIASVRYLPAPAGG